MNCPRCHCENPFGSNFCLTCGTRLGTSCRACGNDISFGSRFCNKCGTPVSGESPGEARLVSPASYTPKHLVERILLRKAPRGERKMSPSSSEIAESTRLAESSTRKEHGCSPSA